jgi:hypothetical protein
MSVNMIAASRRVSAGLTLALSSDMAAIIEHVACGCQTVLARRFPCPRVLEGVKRQHALCEL